MAEQQTKKQVVHHRVALMDANGMSGAPDGPRVGLGMGKSAARRQQQGKTGSDVMPKKRRKPNGEGKILSVFG